MFGRHFLTLIFIKIISQYLLITYISNTTHAFYIQNIDNGNYFNIIIILLIPCFSLLKLGLDTANGDVIKNLKLDYDPTDNSDYPSTFSIEFNKFNRNFKLRFIKLNKDDSYPIGSADIYYTKDGSPTKFDEKDPKTQVNIFILYFVKILFI
jgi:hypothetical protein